MSARVHDGDGLAWGESCRWSEYEQMFRCVLESEVLGDDADWSAGLDQIPPIRHPTVLLKAVAEVGGEASHFVFFASYTRRAV